MYQALGCAVQLTQQVWEALAELLKEEPTAAAVAAVAANGMIAAAMPDAGAQGVGAALGPQRSGSSRAGAGMLDGGADSSHAPPTSPPRGSVARSEATCATFFHFEAGTWDDKVADRRRVKGGLVGLAGY